MQVSAARSISKVAMKKKSCNEKKKKLYKPNRTEVVINGQKQTLIDAGKWGKNSNTNFDNLIALNCLMQFAAFSPLMYFKTKFTFVECIKWFVEIYCCIVIKNKTLTKILLSN